MLSTATASFLSRHGSNSALDKLPPLLYRVFCNTFQRQIAHIRSFNSHAAYIIISDDDCQSVVWIGSLCSEADKDLALQNAKEIMMRDFGEVPDIDIPTLYEIDTPGELLKSIVESLGSDMGNYNSKVTIADRRENIENSAVSVNTLIQIAGKPGEFEKREKSFAHPNVDGVVPRVDFVHIEKNTLAYIKVGDQYDLWIARGVSPEQEQYAVAYMERLLDHEVFEDAQASANKSRFVPYFQVVYQGEERYAFRRPLKIFTDFEPVGRTVPKKEIPLEDKTQPTKRGGKMESSVSFAHDLSADGGKQVAFENQRAAAVSAIRRADAGKASRLPVTFSEFRLEEERDILTRADNLANSSPYKSLNFWQDVKPQQANRTILFGEYSPINPDYAPAPKIRMTMGDRNRILPQHFEIIEHENLDMSGRKDLLMRAKHDPCAMLGWQIEIDEGLYCGVYVIIGYRKSFILRKSYFQAVAKDMSEHWLRLQRGHVKHGLVFRPLRQVARVAVAQKENTSSSDYNRYLSASQSQGDLLKDIQISRDKDGDYDINVNPAQDAADGKQEAFALH
jgi:hypothetical protein